MARPAATLHVRQTPSDPDRFTWDIGDVEFEPGSGNGKPLVPDDMKEAAKRRLPQAKAVAPIPSD